MPSDGDKKPVADSDPEVFIVDEYDAKLSGKWLPSTYAKGQFYGQQYLHSGEHSGDLNTARFVPPIQLPGRYEIFEQHNHAPGNDSGRSKRVPLLVVHAKGKHTVYVDQTRDGGRFNSIGVFDLRPGDYVEVSDKGIDTPVIIDAFKFVRTDKRPASAKDKQATVVPSPLDDLPKGQGLTATYYKGKNFETLIGTMNEVPFFTSSKGLQRREADGAKVPGQKISARWEGYVKPVHEEGKAHYLFQTKSDDGVRLWVNGKLLIDNWTDHGTTLDSGGIELPGGTRVPMVLEYYQGTGSAHLELLWAPPTGPPEKIPVKYLFPKDDQWPADGGKGGAAE